MLQIAEVFVLHQFSQAIEITFEKGKWKICLNFILALDDNIQLMYHIVYLAAIVCFRLYFLPYILSCLQMHYLFVSGNYFSSHFIMGGEKFKTVDPESFLFGDNSDLNYLNNKPTPVST